jgi:MtN3 and saliva related transmembrane protein
MIDALGFAAATLTTLAFLPQVLKSWRRRSVDDLSLWMLVALNVGIVLWIAYGLAIAAFPLVLANVVTLVFTAILLGLKIGVRPHQR